MPRVHSPQERLQQIVERHQTQRDDIRQQFSDREALVQEFEEILNTPKGQSIPVMMIYGVGGIGKTWFLNYAIESICRPRGIPYAHLDFRDEIYRVSENALFRLRSDIQKRYKFRFGRFDLVWAEYTKKTQGYRIKREDLIPEELETIADLLDALELVPFIGEVAKAVKLVDLLGRRAVAWFQRHFGEKWGSKLDEMEPADLADVMPLAFAEDLNDGVQDRDIRFVLFLDTFEKVEDAEGSFIREMAGTLEHVFLVVGGRDCLQWGRVEEGWAQESHLRQLLVGNFSETDARQYLRKFDIDDEALVSHLYQITQGHIQYLALAVDLVRAVRGKGERTTKDRLHLRAKEELLPRLLGELSGEERDIVLMAAVPRWFSEEVLEQLSNRPQSVGRLMSGMVRHSFVEPSAEVEDTYRLHAVVRDLLLTELQGKPFYRCWQEQLVQYFSAKVEGALGEERLAYVVEQIYHEFSIDEWQGYQHFRHLFERALRFRHLGECRALLQAMPTKLGDYRHQDVGLWVEKWRADLLRMEYRNSEAKALYESLLAKAGEDQALRAHILRSLGSVMWRLNAYEQGQECYQQGLEAARTGGERQVESDLLRRIGNIHRSRGQEDVAFRLLQEALEMAEATEDQPTMALVLNDLGLAAAKFGNWEDARRYYTGAASRWESLGASIRETAPWQNLGVLEIRWGKLEDAAEKFCKHLVMGWQEKIWGRIEIALNNLGAIAHNHGHFDAGVLYRSQRLAIRRARGGRTTEAFAMRGLGMCLARAGRWGEAEDLLQEALDIYLDVSPSSSRLSGVHRNLARLYVLEEKLDEALGHVEEALRIAEARGSVAMQMRAKREMGYVLLARGETELAVYNFQATLEMSKSLEARLIEEEILIGIGCAHLDLNQFEKARGCLERGLALARKIGTRRQEVEALVRLGDLHYRANEESTANDYLYQAEARARAKPVMNVMVVWDQGPLSEIEERPVEATPYFDWLSRMNYLRATWALENTEITEAARGYTEALCFGYRYNGYVGERILEDLRTQAVLLATGQPQRVKQLLSEIMTALREEAGPEVPPLAENTLRECIDLFKPSLGQLDGKREV